MVHSWISKESRERCQFVWNLKKLTHVYISSSRYMKYLYPYECEKKHLSTPAELQAAIDGNRREGRRTSYGQFESQMSQQLQMVRFCNRSSILPSTNWIISLSHRCNDRLFPTVCSKCLPCRLWRMEIHKINIDLWVLHQSVKCPAWFHMTLNRECSNTSNSSKHQKTWNVRLWIILPFEIYFYLFSLKNKGPQSPEVSREALNALEMSRMALWNMYQNASPPNQLHTTSPPEVQREALNLQRESPSPIPPAPSPIISIKRERDHNDISDYHVPPAKRGLVRSNNEIHRKSSINNNNHHHISNNNSHVTPTKVTNKSLDRSESPNIENGNHHRSLTTHHKQQQNGMDNLGTTMLNGMQFKIISKGKSLKTILRKWFTNSLF